MNEDIILVVEDDKSVANLITTTLKINDYHFKYASSGKEAISLCASYNPNVILLDLGLPDIDGLEVIKSIRGWSKAMIIIISARSDDQDKIKALDMGADDYLTKPFSVDELLARVRVAIRRMKYLVDEKDEAILVNGNLIIDYASNVVKVDGNEIHLTSIEYKLLCLLAQNIGKVLTHTYIINHVWGNQIESDIASLRVYMTTLRKKIKGNHNEEIIKTHIGIGYQMIKL